MRLKHNFHKSFGHNCKFCDIFTAVSQNTMRQFSNFIFWTSVTPFSSILMTLPLETNTMFWQMVITQKHRKHPSPQKSSVVMVWWNNKQHPLVRNMKINVSNKRQGKKWKQRLCGCWWSVHTRCLLSCVRKSILMWGRLQCK